MVILYMVTLDGMILYMVILYKMTLDMVTLDGITLDRIILDRIILDKIILDKIILDMNQVPYLKIYLDETQHLDKIQTKIMKVILLNIMIKYINLFVSMVINVIL